ncbi:MAG TPA: ABC transporter permease [Bacillota bacterium]|jgi:putative ABC transport system permease protein|nr:ABC transporter permease [Fastidiosipila sp.]HPX92892.1 ABC transporter permease [Bacillota bacterium]HQB80718.1 ABC transporter permease [Bacillota bacterium]
MNLSFSNLLDQLPGALAQGMIWGILAIGVYITYKVLDMADLTVDGSFCTGGAVLAVLLVQGWGLWPALALAVLAGALAGLVTGIFHVLFGISPLLAGILTQIGLWAVNLSVMGKPNLALNVNHFRLLVSLRYLQEVIKGERAFHGSPLFVAALFLLALIALLYWFFGTEFGTGIRATGANISMAKAQGISTGFAKIAGLMLSNSLVALSGALLTQYQGFADINMGRGAIIIGLAAVIIGEVLLSRVFRNFALRLLSSSMGAVIYFAVIQSVLWLRLDPNYLKLLTAVVVAVFLALPHWKSRLAQLSAWRKGGGDHA